MPISIKIVQDDEYAETTVIVKDKHGKDKKVKRYKIKKKKDNKK